MELKEHVKRLKKRANSGAGNAVVAYEVKKWPEGRVKQLVGMGVLRSLPDADEIRCPACTDHHMIIPLKTTLPNGDFYAEYLCSNEGLIEIPDFLFKQWEIVGEIKPKQEDTAYLDKKFAELIKELQAKDPDGAVKKSEYKWQKVLKKVEDFWKEYKADEKKKGIKAKDVLFPPQRSIAREIGENVGTIKKAITYSRSLSRAFNKGKTASKKVKFVDPSKLDFVGPKVGRKGGKPDPAYEEKKECLLDQIKKAARKESNNFDPDVNAYGNMILRNMKAVSGLHIEGLKELLGDLTENRSNRQAKFKAAFNADKL